VFGDFGGCADPHLLPGSRKSLRSFSIRLVFFTGFSVLNLDRLSFDTSWCNLRVRCGGDILRVEGLKCVEASCADANIYQYVQKSQRIADGWQPFIDAGKLDFFMPSSDTTVRIDAIPVEHRLLD
jgi:hypothetical protein